LLLGLLFFRHECAAWLKEFGCLSAIWSRTRRLEKGLAVLMILMVGYQLIYALAPATKWDSLAYHLQLPQQFLEAGSLRFIPENPYWGQIYLAEMLFTFSTALHRVETAAALTWGLGVMFLVGTLGFTRARLAAMLPGSDGVSAGWAAVAALVAGFTLRAMLGWAYTDLISALAGLAALIALFEWLPGSNWRWFLGACLFAGLAASIKFTAGIIAGGIFLLALLRFSLHRIAFRHLLLGGVIFLVGIAPLLIKNTIATGNPLYPYFFETPWIGAARMAEGGHSTEPVILWMRALLPFSITWAGVESAPPFSTDIGPLLLIFSAPGFWWLRKEERVRAILWLLLPAALVLGVVGIWQVHLSQTRLMFVLLPGLAAAAGWGWERLQGLSIYGARLRRILGAVLVLVIGLAFWQDTREIVSRGAVRVVLGIDSRQTYLENNLGFYMRAMQALHDLPAGAKPLLLWEARGLYAPLAAVADPWIDRWRTDSDTLGSAQAILNNWKAQGITHLLVYDLGLDWIRPAAGAPPGPRWLNWKDMDALLLPSQSIGGGYYLYKLP
jgi:hypothetical protein